MSQMEVVQLHDSLGSMRMLTGWFQKPKWRPCLRLVSVVKMTTVLEGYPTEEQHSVVRVSGQKDSMQRILIKKYFLFTVGSVYRVERFTTGSINSL
jgi:hypothetical protein